MGFLFALFTSWYTHPPHLTDHLILIYAHMEEENRVHYSFHFLKTVDTHALFAYLFLTSTGIQTRLTQDKVFLLVFVAVLSRTGPGNH